MKFQIKDLRFYMYNCHTRLPFRFGIAHMTWAPSLVARVEIETEGGRHTTGASADILAPKWFDKTPELSFQQNIEDLKTSADRAASILTRGDLVPMNMFDLWHHLYQECYAGVENDTNAQLVTGFGVALLERALIDAVCRAGEISFFDAFRIGFLGFVPGRIHPQLTGWNLNNSMPESFPQEVRVRHTVGMADPLRTAEIGEEERLNDGLPQSLEENIRFYGLTCFKVKVCGELAADLERLLSIAAIIRENVEKPLITLDGNEQFTDPREMVRLIEELRKEENGNFLLEHMKYIEQPLARAIAFDPEVTDALKYVSAYSPVIIDESDSGLDVFPLAVKCGYQGVSIKNCKGVFHSFLNMGLCEFYTKEKGKPLFQSAEDLTNLGILALQQDLCSVGSIGLTHVERNGHHYFSGLRHLPHEDSKIALQHHPDLYTQKGEDVFLNIKDGKIRMNSLNCLGYGHSGKLNFDQYTPAENWKFPEDLSEN